jgi:peptide/nickel transport system substrate-binding protein
VVRSHSGRDNEGAAVEYDGYWARRRVSRRAALRGLALGAGGIGAAALIGCGTEEAAPAPSTPPPPDRGTPTTTGATTGGGKVSADQVRIKPGYYEWSLPPTPAEADPMANGRRGGTLLTRYLDPPHMNFNRTLSCTVNTTMDYTKNKLTRAIFGARARQEHIDIEPDLAESWEVNDQATVFTFKLRSGVKFHNVAPLNGREFTADDVRASVERYQAGGVQKDVWAVVEKLETPDDHTVVFTLNQPLSDFPRNMAAWSHMDAREVVEDEELNKTKAMGTGPFIQEEWTPKVRSVFVRNPDYFEEGLPFLDKVIASVQNDQAAQRAGFTTNNYFDWGARDEVEAEQMLGEAKEAVYFKYRRAQGANTDGFHFQMKNPKWQDERARRALSMAIDRVEYDLARFNGESGNGYAISPIAWPFLHETQPTLEQQGPWYQYNPEEASKLLQAAGYSASNPITVDMPVWYQREAWNEIVKPMYDMIPEIKSEVRIVDNPTAVQMLNDRNYDDTMNITWGPPAYSVDQMVFPWYHSKGGLNHNNVNDAEMDRLVTAQRAELVPEAQKELWHQIEARIFDQVWDVFVPRGQISRGFWHNYMINYRPHGIGSYVCYGNAQARSAWLDEGAPGAALWPLPFVDGSV